jgi:hypothetical protein
MGILLGVEDRSIAHTHAPSEPILSMAACEILNKTLMDYVAAVHTLANMLGQQSIIVDRGKQGELFSRLLLTIARDQATCGPGNELQPRPSYISNISQYRLRVITLWQLLSTLLGPDGLKNQPRLEAHARAAHVNFTHFIQLQDVIEGVTSDFLQNAWERGAAFQAAHNQPTFDLFVVAYSGDLDRPWD